MEILQVKLGFKILMITAVVDGRYDIKEGQVINKFLQKNAPSTNVAEFEEDHNELLDIKINEHIDFCMEYAKSFDIISTKEQKLELIYYIFEVIFKDGNITTKEKNLLLDIAKVFDEDIEFLFKDIEL